MKIINICILFFLASGYALGEGDTDTTQPIFPQQLTARDLLTYCTSSSMTDLGRKRQRYCSGFISGVEETIRLPMRVSSQPLALKTCVPIGVSSRNLVKAYTQYAGGRDAKLERPAAQIVVDALSSSYPCPH